MILENFIVSLLTSIFLVFTTSIIFYEILRFCWGLLPNLKMKPRKRILVLVFFIFFAHTVCIWLYGITYYVLVEYFNIGGWQNAKNVHFLNYIYFSAESYSSLGLADIIPKDAFRFLAGVEALNGLVLIGWSVSSTYLAMERFWSLHRRNNVYKDQ